MSKNILSIDFDIIMAPSIELYNDKVPQITQEDLIDIFPIFQFLPFDSHHYRRLIAYLLKIAPSIPADNIHIAWNHGKIMQYLKDDETYNIVNIDHHHDLGYTEVANEMPDDCANWALHALTGGRMEHYTWIHNRNSHLPIQETIDLFQEGQFEEYAFEDIENLAQTLQTPDEIFICMSPEWVPVTYRQLFYSLLDVLNSIKDTFYQLED